MRFSLKLTLALSLLLAVVLSLGGTLLVQQNFESALQNAIAQSTGVHLMEKYTLEANLLEAASAGRAPGKQDLARSAESIGLYLGASRDSFALLCGGEYLYSNLPGPLSGADVQASLDAGANGCVVRKTAGGYSLLMASPVQSGVADAQLVSAVDITYLFEDRTAQLHYLWRLEAVLLAAAILVAALLSHLLTRPIRKLRAAAHHIAGGAYSGRTGVSGNDEIADLAREFDRMAEAVQHRVEQLNASIRQRDDFVAAFSHEVKTPITTLVGYGDLLRRAVEPPEVRRMAAAYIYTEARRLEALSRKLMELMGLGEGEIERQCFSARALLADAARPLEKEHPGIRLEGSGDLDATLLADRVLAGDLLQNLLSNAARASQPGGVIRVHFRAGRAHCRVLVQDTGGGLPAEELARITEPFYMVDKSRARSLGGSGMGLALAKRIAQLYGGQLRFKSRPGAGTIVRFTLPLEGGAP